MFKKRYGGSVDNVRFVLKGTEEQLSAISSASFEESGIHIQKEDKKALKSMQAAENDEFIEFNKSTLTKSFIKYCSENGIVADDRKRGLGYMKQI